MRTQTVNGQFIGGEYVELAIGMVMIFYLGVIYLGAKADEACKKRKRRKAEREKARADSAANTDP